MKIFVFVHKLRPGHFDLKYFVLRNWCVEHFVVAYAGLKEFFSKDTYSNVIEIFRNNTN